MRETSFTTLLTYFQHYNHQYQHLLLLTNLLKRLFYIQFCTFSGFYLPCELSLSHIFVSYLLTQTIALILTSSPNLNYANKERKDKFTDYNTSDFTVYTISNVSSILF